MNFKQFLSTKRLKLVGIAVFGLLILIVILQNTETVQTEILFIDIQMPRALLLFFTTLIGFIVGVLTSVFLLRKEKKKRKELEDPELDGPGPEEK